jgi:hypothetical protein
MKYELTVIPLTGVHPLSAVASPRLTLSCVGSRRDPRPPWRRR